jgi:hypothetical protein
MTMTLSWTTDAIAAHPSYMDARNAAQAMELIRALCDALDGMTRQLPWLEHGGAQLEAAALRQGINEAQILIDRLERCYLNGNRHASTSPATRELIAGSALARV